jgi:deazaflavin-dependent oxidoreductase (nitroreductase family)
MGNRVVLTVLRSPFGRLLAGLCTLEFSGRRTGRTVHLPVQYARDGDQVAVYVGHSAGKRWWRNFTDPHPVRVSAGGHTSAGTGRLTFPGDPDRTTAERIYRQRYPKVAPAVHDPMVLIDLAARGR